MKSAASRNLAASVRARLKRYADEAGQDFNLTLTRYGLERLLYRLSVSAHAESFLLKGALLFSLWYDTPHRPTRDVDLLGFGADDVASVVAVFEAIARVAVDDGMEFDPQSVKGQQIRKDAGYGGVRIDMLAKLDGARIALQVDVGFGDAVTPGPHNVIYPVLLAEQAAPQLRAYPKATVVAEKLHAISLLGMANTRMKDYFDLWVLLQDSALDHVELCRALAATFERRGTALPSLAPTGLSDVFGMDASKQVQWQAFLKKNQLSALPLPELVVFLRTKFIAIVNAAVQRR
jgi:predicted nucleotidyltransferase component of viral defense system